MLNLIKMNIYRFFRTRSFYVITIVSAVLLFFVVADEVSMQNDETGKQLEQELLEEYGGEENAAVGLTLMPMMDSTITTMCESYVGSGIMLCYIAIFMVLYSNKERESGFLKNLQVCSSRSGIFAAKLVPLFLFVLVQFGIMLLCTGTMLKNDFSVNFGMYLGVEFFFHAAWGVAVLTVMELLRSLAGGLLVGVFASMGIVTIILNFLEGGLASAGVPSVFFLSRYTLINRARMLTVADMEGGLMGAAALCIIWLIFFFVVGMTIFKKKDIY